jgi:hypothetical protein
VQRSRIEISAAAQHFNNFEHVIKKFVTTTNFMADEHNKFYFMCKEHSMA